MSDHQHTMPDEGQLIDEMLAMLDDPSFRARRRKETRELLKAWKRTVNGKGKFIPLS